MALFPKVNLKYLFEILFCMRNFPNRTEQNRTEQNRLLHGFLLFSLIYVFIIMQIFLFSSFHLIFYKTFADLTRRKPIKTSLVDG